MQQNQAKLGNTPRNADKVECADSTTDPHLLDAHVHGGACNLIHCSMHSVYIARCPDHGRFKRIAHLKSTTLVGNDEEVGSTSPSTIYSCT